MSALRAVLTQDLFIDAALDPALLSSLEAVSLKKGQQPKPGRQGVVHSHETTHSNCLKDWILLLVAERF